jgi:predicted DsbA family dithiol-disulfide isomerase
MTRLRIDFISDISCPWCVVGLRGLEEALHRTRGDVEADIHIRPFELNPDMPAGGQNLHELIAARKTTSTAQFADFQKTITQRAATLGFTMNYADEFRVYNTFDAHRLIYWAGTQGLQKELKNALFDANFTRNAAMDDHAALAAAAERAGLDPEAAADVLASGRYGDEVRAEEQLWRMRGISGVPAIVINEAYLISGGQPADVFEQALRQIAGEVPGA